ncbi:MAG: shikimate kinase [Sphingomonadales bacterium]
MRIYLIGFMGAGKSYWGPRLAQEAGLRFYDLDREIEESQALTIDQLFTLKGEESFRALEKDQLHSLTEGHADFVMACGGGTPCFLNNIEYMKRSGKVVWINPAIEVLAKRLWSERMHRPLLRSVSETELVDFIYKKMADRRLYYEQADIKIDEESVDVSALLTSIHHV